jgi:hypothetical protein
MNILLTLLGAAFGIGGFVCGIIILIEAFKDEVWKGFVCLLCGFYMLWYALCSGMPSLTSSTTTSGALSSAGFLAASSRPVCLTLFVRVPQKDC